MRQKTTNAAFGYTVQGVNCKQVFLATHDKRHCMHQCNATSWKLISIYASQIVRDKEHRIAKHQLTQALWLGSALYKHLIPWRHQNFLLCGICSHLLQSNAADMWCTPKYCANVDKSNHGYCNYTLLRCMFENVAWALAHAQETHMFKIAPWP